MRRAPRWAVQLVVFTALFSGGRAAAQFNYYWGGGDGTWDSGNFTNGAWRADSPGGLTTFWTNSILNTAHIGNNLPIGKITIVTTIQAAGISIEGTGFTLQTDGNAQTVTSNITLGTGITLNLHNASTTGNQSFNIQGNISGGSGIRIQGATTSGSASIINMNLASTSVSSPIIVNLTGSGVGGIVATATGIQISGTIANSSSGATALGATAGNDLTLTSAAVISGSQGVRFAAGDNGGTGTITLNSLSTYSGATLLNMGSTGVVRLGVSNALPTGTNVTFGNASGLGGNLDLNGASQQIASLASVSGAVGGIRNNATGTTSTLTVSGSASTSFGLVIADNTSGTGKVALVKSGTGTLTLTAANTYTGGTTVSGGTLALGNATNTLANTGAVTVSGGTLSLGSNSDTVGAVTLSSGSITGSGTLTGSSYDVRLGTISANLGGSGALTKSTSDTVTLSGSNNTYSGGTTINGGTLVVTGGGSATGSGSVTVNNTGTLAGDNGTGSLTGAVTVASGGTLAPGTGGTTTGLLKVSNNVTLQSGSTFDVQIKGTTAGSGYDQLQLSAGNVSLGGALNVDLSTFTTNGTEHFSIINNTSTTATLTGTFSNFADGDTVSTYSGVVWKIYYGASADAFGGTNSNDVMIVATPEPASIIAICALAAGVILLARHLRSRSALRPAAA